jgi:hypothetical protein
LIRTVNTSDHPPGRFALPRAHPQVLIITHTGRDTFTLSGAPVSDAEALSQMDIPGHETCIEVANVEESEASGVATG